MKFDVVIIGSGPAGVSAAYPLVKAGLKVAIIDGGLDDKKENKQPIDDNTAKQYTSPAYDLIKKSSYIFNKTYQLLPIQSNLEIIQSLAKGGLSKVWSGICDYYSNEELEKIGLPVNEIKKEYLEITERIKPKVQRKLDRHSELILQSAQKRTNLKNEVYQTLIVSYTSSLSIKDLMHYENFTYIPNQLVSVVNDKESYVEIESFIIDTSQHFTTSALFVIMAAGSINTTRILLRSLELFNYKTSFLTKAHYLTACLQLKTLFRGINQKKSRSGQVVISSKKTNQELGAFFIQMYRYNPQMLYKALGYIPLPRFIALPLLSTIISSVVVADVRFPAFESKNKFCLLRKTRDGKDILEISFRESQYELENHKVEFVSIKSQLKNLGLFPLKTISDYTTAHYAGGVPFQIKPGKLSVDADGKLHQARRIYVADASTWRALPAKPPTLTIMANASRIGKKVVRNFHSNV